MSSYDWLARGRRQVAIRARLGPARPIGRRVCHVLHHSVIRYLVTPNAPLSRGRISIHFGISHRPIHRTFVGLTRGNLVRVHPRHNDCIGGVSVTRIHGNDFVHRTVRYTITHQTTDVVARDRYCRLRRGLRRRHVTVRHGRLSSFFRLSSGFRRLLARVTSYRLT